jgi:hypothetical protein
MQNQPAQGKVKLELSIDEINIVLMGLVKLPYETSAQVVDVVRIQASEQVQKMQAPQNSNLDGVNVNSVQ